VVVVLGRVGPGLVGDAPGGVGDAGALFGQFQGGPLGLGEDGCLPPAMTVLRRLTPAPD
jgi:hypothetical protein